MEVGSGDMKEMVTKNSFNFCPLQKVLMEKLSLKLIDLLMQDSLMKKSLWTF